MVNLIIGSIFDKPRAFLAHEILKQSLAPLLGAEFDTYTEQIKHICYTVIMATGRHHSAWASGWNVFG